MRREAHTLLQLISDEAYEAGEPPAPGYPEPSRCPVGRPTMFGQPPDSLSGMTMRPIRIIGDPVLRTPAESVTSFDAELRALVTDLMDTMLGAPGRAGVAAPQIGVSAQVFVYDAGGRRGHLINPVLELSEETEPDDEGCLSVPGLYFPTVRARHATAHGVDQHGEPLTISGSGFLARALQHETDHLRGRLYVDTLTGQTRRQALREIRAGRFGGPTRDRSAS